MKNRIKVIRTEMKMTQKELAEITGLSRTSIAMIENEKSVPDGNTIAKLVSALKTPANEIFFDLNVV